MILRIYKMILQLGQETRKKHQVIYRVDIAQDEALIKEDENMQEDLCNEEFKRSFKNFIARTTSSQVQLGANENAPNKLIDSIETHSLC